jgi:hypothetical protein
VPYFADRVKDTTATTGTSDFTLDVAVIAGFQQWGTAFTQPVRVAYACVAADGTWEVGKGTFDGASTITRDLVRDGSSGKGVKVSFGAGVKDIFLTASAEHIDNCNIGMQYAQARGMMMP